MGRFNVVALAAILTVAGCGTPDPGPVVVAPQPVQYTCEQSRQAAAEFDALPAHAMIRVYITDYGRLRRALRAALRQPDPPRCPPA